MVRTVQRVQFTLEKWSALFDFTVFLYALTIHIFVTVSLVKRILAKWLSYFANIVKCQFTAAVFGGIGSIPGAMIGGFAIGLLEALVSAAHLSMWKDAAVFLVLIIVLLVKPTGFLGKKIQEGLDKIVDSLNV